MWPVDIPEEEGEEFGMPLKEDCTISGGRRIYNCGVDSAFNMLSHTLPNIDGSAISAEDLDWKDKSKGVL